MPLYELKHKDLTTAVFRINRSDILSAEIFVDAYEHLPLPLKRAVHYKDEFVEHLEGNRFILNDEGCLLIDCWLSDREIPVNRENFSSYVQKGSTSRQFMLENYGYSLTDCYWICSKDDHMRWKDIEQKRASVDDYVSVKDSNKMYKGQNATLGGQLEKFWYKSGGQLKLCKKSGPLYDILSAREVFASEIYRSLRYKNHCDYEFVYDTAGDVTGCKCFSFVKDNTELITAYDLLEEYNLTQSADVYEKIVELSSYYGASKQETENYLDIQSVVDYLITNRDRHQGNIGFLRDADTLSILSPAPVYDSGSCKHLEGEKPEDTQSTKVNGLYPTEGEILEHVKNWAVVDVSKLPSKEKLCSVLDECRNVSEYRKNTLLSLYEQKKDCILQKQMGVFQQEEDREDPDL